MKRLSICYFLGILLLSCIAVNAYAEKTLTAAQLQALRPYMVGDRIFDPDELDSQPYVIAAATEHLVSGNGDKFYARGLKSPTVHRYSIYRRAEPYIDPTTKKIIGYAGLHVGDATLEDFGDPSTLLLMNMEQQVGIGDRLLPQSYSKVPSFTTRLPSLRIEGRILAVVGGTNQTGQYGVVVVNRGTINGLQPGDLLTICHDGDTVVDPITKVKDKKVEVKLPDYKIGELLIFRTFKHLSYGVVLYVNSPVYVMDIVRS